MRLRNGPQNFLTPRISATWYIVDQAIVFRTVCFSIARSYVLLVYVYGWMPVNVHGSLYCAPFFYICSLLRMD